MAKTKRVTRSFKERQCEYCRLTDQRELRKGRPNYCGYKKKTGRDPDIRNGHCVPRVPAKKGKEADNAGE